MKPLCLPEKAENSSESIQHDFLRFQGWSPNQQDNDKLYLTEINVNVKFNAECNHLYQSQAPPGQLSLALPELLTSFMFCAGTDNDDSCTSPGDSGGPAFRRIWSNNSGRYELIGVLSGGFKSRYSKRYCKYLQIILHLLRFNPGGCGIGNGFYNFVSHVEVLPWIIDNIKKSQTTTTTTAVTTTNTAKYCDT